MEKSYENYLIYCLLGLVIFAFAFAVYDYSKTTITGDATQVNNEANDVGKTFESIISGSTEQGDVSVELTPYEISNNQLKVKIATNTHSVDMSQFNLKQITTLEYNGKKISPISAPDIGGHHVNGELVFNIENGKELNLFSIKIKGIPKVDERVFNWKIEK